MTEIRDLTTFDECLQVVGLQKEIWGFPIDDIVPAAVLIVSIKRGAILLGGFDRAEMRGFVYSVPGLKDGSVTQWSHMLGVVREARGRGLGLRLKLAQRERALSMGIDIIEWTYDPLQAANAHLNLARLGAVVSEYQENVYGKSSSPLHRGTPTDRFVAEWRLTEPHVVRRISGPVMAPVRDVAVMAAPLVNPSIEGGTWLKPAPAPDLECGGPRLLVEIPMGFTEMLGADPALALDWRLATRAIFRAYLSRSYGVVDFLLSRASGRGQYLLAKTGTTAIS